jgi:hypothetical protein
VFRKIRTLVRLRRDDGASTDAEVIDAMLPGKASKLQLY